MSAEVVHNAEQRRYELRDGDELLGFSAYLPGGRSLIVSHTEIDERREGEGLGAQLVRGTLDAIRATGMTVIPTCPFTAAFIRRHPEYADLVDASMRGQFPDPRRP